MPLDDAQDVSIKIPMPGDLRERWEKFTYDRGYGKGPFLRSFIEAVTDPARGPVIERIMRGDAGSYMREAALEQLRAPVAAGL